MLDPNAERDLVDRRDHGLVGWIPDPQSTPRRFVAKPPSRVLCTYARRAIKFATSTASLTALRRREMGLVLNLRRSPLSEQVAHNRLY
jgi:hypothetical protein